MKLDIDYTEAQARDIANGLYALMHRGPRSLSDSEATRLARAFFGIADTMQALREIGAAHAEASSKPAEQDGRTLDEIAREESDGRFNTMRELLDYTKSIASDSAKGGSDRE